MAEMGKASELETVGLSMASPQENDSLVRDSRDEEEDRYTKTDFGTFRRMIMSLGMTLDSTQSETLSLLESKAVDEEDEEDDDFDYSAGGDIKVALAWVFAGVVFSNLVAVTLYHTGTFQDSDGSVAMQNFYAG